MLTSVEWRRTTELELLFGIGRDQIPAALSLHRLPFGGLLLTSSLMSSTALMLVSLRRNSDVLNRTVKAHERRKR